MALHFHFGCVLTSTSDVCSQAPKCRPRRHLGRVGWSRKSLLVTMVYSRRAPVRVDAAYVKYQLCHQHGLRLALVTRLTQ